MKDLLFKMIMGNLVAFLLLCMLEFAAGFFVDTSIYDGDPNTLWWLKSNIERNIAGEQPFHLRTNSRGTRGKEYNGSEESAIAFLGCSTTMGWGVEEDKTYVSLIGEHLQIPVINMGQPGWSTQQAVLGLPRYQLSNVRIPIISYLIRDAQRSTRPDHKATPSSPASRLNILKLLSTKRHQTKHSIPQGTSFRVPPTHYRENIRQLFKMFKNKPILFAFPSLTDHRDHTNAVSDMISIQLQQFSPNEFLEDGIHLNEKGHKLLANKLLPIILEQLNNGTNTSNEDNAPYHK